MGRWLNPRRQVAQVHFGGGTPTFLLPDELRALGQLIHSRFPFAPDAEMGVEIDPRRLSRDHAQALREVGFNRASIGVQDHDPVVQKAVHRIQPFAQTKMAVDWLRPYPIRFAVVHFCILPFRAKQSAEAYHKVWTSDGSPLVVISQRAQRALQQLVDVPVELAMRYQKPSIESAVEKLGIRGVEDLLLIPLFPHYAMSSYETAVERVKTVLARTAPQINLRVAPPYFDQPDYIEALSASAATYLARDHDHLLFSFHGVPERHLRKTDPTCGHCLAKEDCCFVPSPAHTRCYRAQCFRTVEAFVKKARVAKYSVAFQSRLGKDPWLQPYTDIELARLARGGVKRLVVICPAFVADCLETLEEIGMRGRATFLAAGGEEFTLIPCLNEHPAWIEALAGMVATVFTGCRREFETTGAS